MLWRCRCLTFANVSHILLRWGTDARIAGTMFVESDGALLIGLAACGVQYSGIAAGAVIGKAISVHPCLDKESFHRLAGRRRTARDYFRNWRRAMHMRMRFFVSYLRLLLPTRGQWVTADMRLKSCQPKGDAYRE